MRFNIDKTETISYYECATNQIFIAVLSHFR
nr:MAG TPA: hypothetical protein [Caudoviricetes sp.]DAN03546.1 MAG TPA: hypothetical protein [Caudoviricetes sp.]